MTQRPHRRHVRVPFGAPVELWRFRAASSVRAADLSAGGVFLRTQEPVQEGSYITIRIALPGTRPFSALCRVVRAQSDRGGVRAPGIALTFVDIAPRDKERIALYVDERSSVRTSA